MSVSSHTKQLLGVSTWLRSQENSHHNPRWSDFGLPAAIRTDNGVPFASGNALFGLSRLAVWWLRLGINIQRIKPGHPQQNGRHERMHLTLKKEATKPA